MLYYDKTNFLETLIKNLPDLVDKNTFLFTASILVFNYFFVIINKNVDDFRLETQAGGINLTLSIFTFFLTTTLSFRLNSAYNSWKSGYSNVTKIITSFKKGLTVLLANYNSVNIIDNSLNNSINLSQDGNTNDNDNNYVNTNGDNEEDNNTNNNTNNRNRIYNFKKNYDIIDNIDIIKEYTDMSLIYLGVLFHLCANNNGRYDIHNFRYNFVNESNEYELYQLESILEMNTKNNILEQKLKRTVKLTKLEVEFRKLISKFKKYNGLSDLDEMGMNGIISEILTTSQDIYNIANIPVVHIYNQFINLCIVMYMLLFSLSMTITSGYYSAIWTTIWSIILFVANNVCNQIDTPFGTENNDIELEIILKNLANEYSLLLTNPNNIQYNNSVRFAETFDIHSFSDLHKTEPNNVNDNNVNNVNNINNINIITPKTPPPPVVTLHRTEHFTNTNNRNQEKYDQCTTP